MRRGIFVLALGVVVGAIAYCCFYLAGTATPRAWMRSAQPEFAWLKHEFGLGDAELQRISELHAGYLPQCKGRCLRIDELNERLSKALTTATQMTPEMEKLLNERAQIRATCQTEMLKHFFEVSRTMPLEQGKRYLAWVRESTCLREQAMTHGEAGAPVHRP